MKRIGIAILSLGAAVFAQDNLALWSKYKTISINTKASGANVPGSVAKFPVLVRLDSVNAPDVFATSGGALAGGADIRFANAAGVAKPYEIEHWDGVAKKAAIWVLADSVKGNDSVATLRLYWGRSSAVSASNASAVWDTANGFVGVWHLGNTSGTDARPNAVIGAPPAVLRNPPVGYQPVKGVIGMADSLIGGSGDNNGIGTTSAGTKNYLDVGRTNYAGYSDFTKGVSYSIWVNPNANLVDFERFFQLTTDTLESVANTSASRIVFLRHTNNTGSLAVRSTGITGGNSANYTHTPGTWRQLAFSKNPGTDSLRIFLDGVRFHAYAPSADIPVEARNYAWIGRSYASNNSYLNAKVDAPVLSKVPRSESWIKLSYETQKATATAVVVGATQLVPAVALAKFAYADTNKIADTLSFVAGATINVSPVLRGGPVDSFKVVGAALPAGLTVNKTTGVLSGSVAAATSAANYVIKAWGHATAGDTLARTVRLTITAPAVDTTSENYTTWTKGRSIWLNTANNRVGAVKIGANVTKFPVLIRIAATDTAFTQAKAGGADLRFAKANGTTALPYQIEQWNSNGAAVWVLVDTVKANDSLQTIRMLWGNTAANSRSNGPAVFSTANGFTAVWHLNDSTTQASAGGQSVTATPSTPAPVAATAANSLIGGAKVFNGTTNWYQIGADSSALNLNTNLGPYTLSGWVNATGCDTRIAIISKYSNSNTISGRQYALHTANTTTTWRFTNGAPALNGNGDAEFAADAPDACVAGTWVYVAGTYRSGAAPTADSAANAKLYVNGALAATGATSAITGTSLGSASQAYIGRIATNERYMNGTLDEVRVHGVARDSNWIKLEYGNQKSGQTFAVLAKPAIVSLSNALGLKAGLGLSVKPSASGLQFRVNGLTAGDKAVLSLVDMFGRTVYGASFSGEALTWNGMNDHGQALSSGVYVARVKVLDAQGQIRKVLEHKLPLAR